MDDSSRQQFRCPACDGVVWLFAAESAGPPCPHCGHLLGVLPAPPIGDLETLGWNLADAKPIELSEVTPALEILELIPEVFVRDNFVFPVSDDSGGLTIAVPADVAFDVLDKLRFVLNRELTLVIAPRSAIVAAIQRCYG